MQSKAKLNICYGKNDDNQVLFCCYHNKLHSIGAFNDLAKDLKIITKPNFSAIPIDDTHNREKLKEVFFQSLKTIIRNSGEVLSIHIAADVNLCNTEYGQIATFLFYPRVVQELDVDELNNIQQLHITLETGSPAVAKKAIQAHKSEMNYQKDMTCDGSIIIQTKPNMVDDADKKVFYLESFESKNEFKKRRANSADMYFTPDSSSLSESASIQDSYENNSALTKISEEMSGKTEDESANDNKAYAQIQKQGFFSRLLNFSFLSSLYSTSNSDDEEAKQQTLINPMN